MKTSWYLYQTIKNTAVFPSIPPMKLKWCRIKEWFEKKINRAAFGGQWLSKKRLVRLTWGIAVDTQSFFKGWQETKLKAHTRQFQHLPVSILNPNVQYMGSQSQKITNVFLHDTCASNRNVNRLFFCHQSIHTLGIKYNTTQRKTIHVWKNGLM